MKKLFFTVAISFLSLVITSAQQKQTNINNKSIIPKEYLGQWQKGVFSLSSFEQFDGKYVGPANETSISYLIEEDGTAKEYFIANTNSYNCRLQVLGFRKGKIIVNNADKSFEFQPDSGYYTSVSCFSKTPTKKPYTEKELYPTYSATGFFAKNEDGSLELITKRKDGSSALVLKKIK